MELGIYHTGRADYRQARNLGLDLVHGCNPGPGKAEFDEALALGLRMFISRDRIVSEETFSHPVIKYWYLQDEPDMHQISPRRVSEEHDWFRHKDRKPLKSETICIVSALWHNHLPWWRRWPGFNYLRYKRCADIIGTDKYSSPKSVRNHLRFNFRPVIAGKKWFGVMDIHRPIGELYDTASAIKDLGADGLLLYAWHEGGWGFNLGERPRVMREIEMIAGALK